LLATEATSHQNNHLLVLPSIPIHQLAVADEAEQFLGYYSWWEGNWEVEVMKGDEVTTLQMEISRHEPNCHLVKGGGISLWGYDPARKKWVGSGFNSEGELTTTAINRHEGEKIRPGAKNHARSRTRKVDGTVVLGDETWAYLDQDTAKITVKSKTDQGESLPNVEWKCRRLRP
jgi:hypothetical protein